MDENLNLARKQLTIGQAHILGYLLLTWFENAIEQNLVVNYKLLILFIKSYFEHCPLSKHLRPYELGNV